MIAIVAPYTASETTAAAVRLADFAYAAGYPVIYLTTQRGSGPLHHFWDSRALSLRSSAYRQALNGIRQVVWFDGDWAFSSVNSCVRDAENLRVLNWHTLDSSSWRGLTRYHALIAPGDSCQHGIQAAAARDWGEVAAPNIDMVRWDSGMPTLHKLPPASQASLRVAVHVDRFALECAELGFWPLLSSLLTADKTMHVMLELSHSVGRRDREHLRQLESEWWPRLDYNFPDSPWLALQRLRECDVSVVLQLRSAFGLRAAQSLAAGAPVIAFDAPPFADQLVHGVHGYLVPVTYALTAYNAPHLRPHFADVEQALVWLLRSGKLERYRGRDWRLEDRRQVFEAFWRRRWQKCC